MLKLSHMNEGALEVVKILCCDVMFLGRIKSRLLYLIIGSNKVAEILCPLTSYDIYITK